MFKTAFNIIYNKNNSATIGDALDYIYNNLGGVLKVENYNALSTVVAIENDIVFVLNSQGTRFWINFKPAGFYKYTGTEWVLVQKSIEFAKKCFQIINGWQSATNAGTSNYEQNVILNHNGIFYINLTGTNTDNAPNLDTTNWGKLKTSNLQVDYVPYDTSYSPTSSEPIGSRYWNSINGTTTLRTSANSELDDGQELRYYGKASGNILNGQLVQFAGSQGDHVLFKLADTTEIALNPMLIMGIATEDIPNGSFGNVTAFGNVTMNTTGWAEGDLIYYDNSTGQLTNIEPQAPDVRVLIAAVIKEESSPSSANGILLIRITWEDNDSPTQLNPSDLYVSKAGNDLFNGQINRKKLTIENALSDMEGRSGNIHIEGGYYSEFLELGTSRERIGLIGENNGRTVIKQVKYFEDNQQSSLNNIKLENTSGGVAIDIQSTLSGFLFNGLSCGGNHSNSIFMNVANTGSGYITIANSDLSNKIINLENTTIPRILYINNCANIILYAGTNWIVVIDYNSQGIIESSSNNNILRGLIGNSIISNHTEYLYILGLGSAGNGFYFANYTEAGVFATGDIIIIQSPTIAVYNKYYNTPISSYFLLSGDTIHKSGGLWKITASTTDIADKQDTITGTNSRVIIKDASGNVISSSISDTILGYLSTLSSDVQTQLNNKQPAGTYNTVIGTDSDINTDGATIIDNINVTDGVITSMGTRILSGSDLGMLNLGTMTIPSSKISVGVSALYSNVLVRLGSGVTSGIVDDSSSSHFIYCHNSATQARAYIRCNGDFASYTNSYGGTSDIRYKRDVIDIDINIEDFEKLRAVKYNYKEDPKEFKSRYGFIAQEVKECIPNLVRYDYLYDEKQILKLDNEGNPILDKEGKQIYDTLQIKKQEVDENGNHIFDSEGNPVYQKIYSLIYSDIQAINTSMIQKLIKQNKEQQNFIDGLLQRVEQLENKINN